MLWLDRMWIEYTDRYEWMVWIIDGKGGIDAREDLMHGIGLWVVGWDAFVDRYRFD